MIFDNVAWLKRAIDYLGDDDLPLDPQYGWLSAKESKEVGFEV